MTAAGADVRIAVLTVPANDAELASDRLWCAGARAVEEREAGAGLVAVRAALGDDAVWVGERVGELPPGWRLEFEDVDPAPAETWRRFARPIRISDDLVIVPAWLAGSSTAGTVGGALTILVEPGGAFGLGDHPTTRLSAAAVDRLVRSGDRMVDVGCGTGVLAVLAARRGAAAVHAIDIAETARAATVANAELNGVAAIVTAATTPLDEVDGQYDVVIANILAPVLVALADDLRRVLAPGGSLVVSGVLADAHEHVVAALSPLRTVRTDVVESWAAIELRHP